jgi:predicted GH43/DUF377 family glycosyl hydrolase
MKHLIRGAWLLGALALAQSTPPTLTQTLPQTLTRTPAQPLLSPQGSGWESKAVFNPAVVWDGQQYRMLYRAQDGRGVSRLGLATSNDGVTFQREPEPVFVPEGPGEAGGVEDPRLIRLGDQYLLTYTAYDGRSAAELRSATSPDLRHWTRQGAMLGGGGAPWSKSGAVLNQPLDGLYFMYYGDRSILLATSKDARGRASSRAAPRKVGRGRRGTGAAADSDPQRHPADLQRTGPPQRLRGGRRPARPR